MNEIQKIRTYIEKLINTLTVRKDENGNVKNIYFSRPIVLPSTETNVEQNYREAIRILHMWIDEVIDTKQQIEDDMHLRKILVDKLRKSM